VECGYCENRCPSREFTLTPRQRIQLRRSLKRLEVSGDQQTYHQLLKEYQFSGMDTCAVDGMCAVDCPVSINTGDLIKRLRRENHGRFANQIARQVSIHFGFVERMVKLALRSGHWMNRVLGKQTMQQLTKGIRKQIPAFPLWTNALSGPVRVIAHKPDEPDVVYFPTCITRMMGADKVQAKTLPEIVKELCDKAGLKIYIPGSVNGVCCGQLFSSKGFPTAYTQTVNDTMNKLWQWTREGKLPVLVDVTSCTHSLQTSYPYLNPENKYRYERLKFIDSIDFAADYLLPRLTIVSPKNTIVFHPVCTVYKMNLLPKLQLIGKHCAGKAEIPFMSSCCGMAGDRGFYYPGLTEAATRAESAEVKQLTGEKNCDGFYSSGKTCEMALQESTHLNYQSIFYLLQDVTEAAVH
ncbi:MAG: (Fe-S)-binding protein, partial [Bacteroidota bacterium]|nr:(Fe-S)-binding protein [Bacteroidota bacterium]